jgi:type I restriction enzyme S subunit
VRIKTGMMHDLLSKGIDKNGQIRSEKTHKFKDSKFGRIPIEWEIKLLGGITEMIQDGTHFSPKPNPLGKHRYVTSKNIRFGYLDFSNCEFISPEDHKRIYSSCRVKYGDVLLTKDGANTGNAAIYDLEEEISLLSSVAVIRGLENSLHNPFLLNYFLSYRGQRIIKDAMSGLAITRVTLEIINSFPILVPPYDEQKRIAQLIETENKIVLSQKDNLVKLSKIKTGLLRDLISGHVSVSEEFIKKLVEQAFVN